MATRSRTPRRHLGSSDEVSGGWRAPAAGVAVLVVLALVAFLSTVAVNGGGTLASPYLVHVQLPADAPVIKPADEVRIGGERVGQVSSVQSGAPGSGPRLTLALDSGKVGPGATVTARVRGLAGLVYLDLAPGETARPLPSGAALPAGAGRTTVQLSDVIGAFDAATRQALRRSLTGYGLGLAGRGPDLGQAVAELPAAAGWLTPLAHALTPRRGDLARLLGRLDTMLRAAGEDGRLTGLVAGARHALDAIDPRAVSATIGALPAFEVTAARVLPQADPLLDDTTATARALSPAVAALRDALPALNQALARRTGLAQLARIGTAGAPVLAAARPLLSELRVPATLLGPLAAPLGPLAASLIPYREEILLAPAGFTQWGGFRYAEGRASGARAVRFSMVLTCHRSRDPYPAPGAALKERTPCR